ncbi:trans-sulfuration enzyme family protein [Youngiibacter fragilis]|uniref:Cystathionine beta-lyase n=1 Tax=Youngiibacter fragilis 232.1 TaxID=994573 RepID=V7I8N1_9CLOT|nr:PLP-dependent aspartate aminotransferase family protein [Youngiibacter fragilis]ETA81621.1 cystathionine beta-lyase [Youngiibacter fragilis 232.1]
MRKETRCVHGANDSKETNGAVSFPIYQSATFSHPGLGESTGYDYSRLQNPTREHLEKVMAALENGVGALAFSSGMAAASALMELFVPGDHIIVSSDTYGGTSRLFRNISVKNGLKFDFTDTSDIELVESLISEDTKAIFIETPTNPMMHVSDISRLSALAKANSMLTIVDNTFLTPYFQQPLSLGADIVLHSGTKYLGGHNDTLAGFLVTKSPEISEKLRFIYKTTGACLSPFDSWLIERGIKTLALRMEKHQKNAMGAARWLENHSKVRKVFYIGLESHPDYKVSTSQTSGFGGMISFEVDSEETVKKVLGGVRLISYAESLGGVESLITYPMLQTHADLPMEERLSRGINEKLLRLSVGIEDLEDIVEDLAEALGD